MEQTFGFLEDWFKTTSDGALVGGGETLTPTERKIFPTFSVAASWFVLNDTFSPTTGFVLIQLLFLCIFPQINFGYKTAAQVILIWSF